MSPRRPSYVAVLPSVYPTYTRRCLASCRYPDEQILVVDNSRENIGVAASWNRGVEFMREREAEWLVIMSASVRFGHAGGLDLIDKLTPELTAAEAGNGLGWHLIAFPSWLFDRVGLFDPNYWPGYCLVPETPVLTDDLRWVPIGTLEVGDALVGVDEFGPGSGVSRSYRTSVVTDTSRRVAQVVRITMQDGKQVTCTLDHQWLAKEPMPNQRQYRWTATKDLRVGCRINTPLDVWPTSQTYEGGWLAGIFDGEGSLHISPRLRGIQFAQKEGAVLDQAKGILTGMGIPFTWRVRADGVANVEVNARRYVMRLLGELRPVRLLQKRAWEGMRLRSRLYPNDIPIESIEPLGASEVVSIETTTKTFMANGMVSHNCEDNDFARRIITTDNDLMYRWPKFDIDAHWVGNAHALKFAKVEVDHEAGLRYYEAKHGGPPGAETFRRPWRTRNVDEWPDPPVHPPTKRLPVLIDVEASLEAARERQHHLGMVKTWEDVERYERIIKATKPEVLVEAGSFSGRSAEWFDQFCEVVSMDVTPYISDETKAACKRTTWLTASTIDPTTVALVQHLVAGKRTMVVLDSDHSAAHVAAEMALYGPLVTPGCYMVVEDGLARWMPENDGYNGSPLDAIEDLLFEHGDEWERDEATETLFGQSQFPAGWLVRR